MKKIYVLMVMFLMAFTVSAQTVLFEEDFDDGNAATRWTISEQGSSNVYDLACNYVDSGLTAAPNGGEMGLMIAVNTSEGAASQVLAFPTGQTFSGSYTLSFDVWMNWEGTSGTTEFALFGIEHTDELAPNNTGIDVAITGDGGAAQDVRLYDEGEHILIDYPDSTAVYLAGAQDYGVGSDFFEPVIGSGLYAGMQWLEVDVQVTDDSAFFYVNDVLWVRYPKLDIDGNVLIGYMDVWSSIAPTTNYIIFDNIKVTKPYIMNNSWTLNPAWNSGSTYRGFAYGDDYLFFGGRTSASLADVQVMDVFTGDSVMALDNTGIIDLTFDLADAEYSDDGSILAAPLTIDASAESGWGAGYYTIYRWKHVDSLPEPFVVYNGSGRIDMFTVVGDVSDDGVIMAAISSSPTVIRYIITDGVVGDAELITIDESITNGTVSVAYPTGLTASDGFWYNNQSSNPILCAADGSIVDYIPLELCEGTTGQIKAFTHDSKDYVLVSDNGKARLFDMTGKLAQDMTQADIVYTSQGVYNVNADVDYRIGPDGSLMVFSFVANSGIYTGVTEMAPIATDLAFGGYAMQDSTLTFNYTFLDLNGDAEGSSIIKWYFADDADGTNQTEITANAGSLTYQPTSDDLGKFIAASVQPVDINDSTYVGYTEMTAFVEITKQAVAPVATDLAIAGDVSVYSELTGSYTYSDDDGDAEGESIYKWWRADDAAGTNAVEVASGSLNYIVQPADTQKYIIFNVIPVSVSPNLTVGDSVAVATATAVTFPEFDPEASDVTISGIEEVTRILTGTYTYSDLNEDPEGESVLTWYRADALDGTKTPVANDTNMYQLVTEDQDKYIFFGVTPVSDNGGTGTEVFDTTGLIAPAPLEEPPVASDVVVSGIPEVGALMSASYTYYDYTDDQEGESIYKWYAADDADGTNPVLIEGAEDQTYLVEEDYIGKYFIFEVTPVALTGGELVGDPVQDTSALAAVASTNTFGLERQWIGSITHGALPHYLGTGTTERGFAVGDDHIYIASRKTGNNIVIVDKTDGSYVGEMSAEAIDVGLFKINDVEVSDDGQILGCPLQLDASAEEFAVYKWENETAEPVKWLTVMADGLGRIGRFTVTGDVSDDAIVMAVGQGTDQLVRWVITDGVAADPEIITLANTTNLLAAAVPFTVDAAANVLVSAKGMPPTIFSSAGDSLGVILGIDEYSISGHQATSPNVFEFKGRTMAAFFQAQRSGAEKGARAIVVDITTQPYQIVDTSEYMSIDDGWYGEVDVTMDEDYYYAYVLQTNKGMGAYMGTLELPEFVAGTTSHDGTLIDAEFSKNLDAATVSDVEAWTVISGTTELTISAVSSVDAIISFDLTDPAVEADVVTIEYDGTGGIVAFDGMPLNAFGPVEVVNIVGADAPVASNVMISGDPRVGEDLTGSYDFTDEDGDLEGTSTYQWYYADNADGTNPLSIIGAFTTTLTVGADLSGKYVGFEVTPVSATGGEDYLVGEAVMSDFVYIIPVSARMLNANSWSIYPNPTNDMVYIEGADQFASFSIYNGSGSLILKQPDIQKSTIELDMSDLKSGIYIVRLVREDGSGEVTRLIKN